VRPLRPTSPEKSGPRGVMELGPVGTLRRGSSDNSRTAARAPAGPVGEYWSLDAIAHRMGVTRNTILDWWRRHGFLMLRRRRGPRWTWWTSDALIHAWLVARCRAQREARLRR
jgi:hypothetical protein